MAAALVALFLGCAVAWDETLPAVGKDAKLNFYSDILIGLHFMRELLF